MVWCVLRPRTTRALRLAGIRGVRGVSLVGQWFSPAQVRRLGWPGPTLQLLVGGFGWRREIGYDSSGWDADAFIDAVHASGRRWSDYTAASTWFGLVPLGIEDTTEFVRYAKAREPRVDIDVALRYGLPPRQVPHDVFPAIHRGLELAGATDPDLRRRLLDEVARAGRDDLGSYQDGWAGLAAWVEHDAPAFVTAMTYATYDRSTHFERWRSWREVGERAPCLQPALWHAAGFTVDEALEMIEGGDIPDRDTLAGLAALRREV